MRLDWHDISCQVANIYNFCYYILHIKLNTYAFLKLYFISSSLRFGCPNIVEPKFYKPPISSLYIYKDKYMVKSNF